CVMLWEIEIQPKGHDPERARICEEFNLLTHSRLGTALFAAAARGYLLEGNLNRAQAKRFMDELLADPLTENTRLRQINGQGQAEAGYELVSKTVLLKPGVMDPAAMSVVEAARNLDIPVQFVRTFRRYYLNPIPDLCLPALQKALANDAIEQVVDGPLSDEH